jgi:hypothetical protein
MNQNEKLQFGSYKLVIDASPQNIFKFHNDCRVTVTSMWTVDVGVEAGDPVKIVTDSLTDPVGELGDIIADAALEVIA